MDKYIDNMLAEEMDLIVLTTDSHRREGLPEGSVGTLICSYTRHDRPLYADFALEGGHREAALGLKDFRVLNPRASRDATLIADFLRRRNLRAI